MSKIPENSLPDIDDPATAPFWEGTRQSKIVVQKCTKCGYHLWPMGPICTECLSSDFAWTEISPTGTLWSYAVYHRPMAARFADEVPYTVALVELGDGPRMYGRLVADTAKIEPGLPVRAVFEEVGPGVTIVNWTIAKA